MNRRSNLKALVRTAFGALWCAVSMAAFAQTDATRNGLTVSVPNGYANVTVQDLHVMTTAGPVRWSRTWDGTEWKINPHWESLSQSWKNLTGSQAIDTLDGTITRDPSQTTLASEPTRSNALLSASGGIEGCYVWVDEDWQPSGQTVGLIGGATVPQMIPERVAPFNRLMGEPGSDYPAAMLLNVDWVNLCPGGGLSAGPTAQDLEGLRRNNELYLGSDGRYSFNSRSVMEKRSVRQLPPLSAAAAYAALGTGQMNPAPVTLANGYRWIDKGGDWIDYSNRGQMVAWGDRNNNTVWLQRDSDGIVRGVVDANGHVVYSLHYTGVLVTEVRDYPVAGNALDLPARSVRYGYDAANRLTRVTDARGFDTFYEYDAQNRIVKITDQEGRAELVAYKGELVSQRTAPDGAVTDYAFDYDDANRQLISKITGPETAAGRMVMDYTHNRAGKLVRRITNGRTDEEVKYDTAARAQVSTNARGFSTRTTKSEFGQVIELAHPDGATQKASYSSLNLEMIDETDELGIRTEYVVDTAGNRLQKTEAVGTPDQRITEYRRNALGQIDQVIIKGRTEANGTVTLDAQWRITEYDPLGQMKTIIDAEGHTHQLTFDRAGNTVRYVNPRNYAVRFSVDAAGNVTGITDALNHTIILRYDRVGNLVEHTDPRLKTTLMAYEDAMNRRTRVTNPVGGSQRTNYNAQGQPITQRDEDDRPVHMAYDNFQRLTRITDALNHLTEFGYSIPDGGQAGQIGSLSLPNEIKYPTFTQRMRYDQRERPTAQTRFNPTAQGTQTLNSNTAYDRRGQRRTETDAYQKDRGFTYSVLGYVTEYTDALLNKTKALYDVRGNLLRLEDANGNVTQFEYDRNNRLVREALPQGQATRYRYDGAGNLDQRIDALNQTDFYAYDAANRLERAERRTADNALQRTTTFGWDEANNLTAWSDTDHTRPAGQQISSATLTYDDANRKSGETITYPTGAPLSYGYGYSLAGKKTRLTWADGTNIGYGYSAHGQLDTVTIPGEGNISVAAFRWTQPSHITFPGGSRQEKTYTGLLTLETMNVKGPSQQLSLTLDHEYGNLQELKTRNRSDAVSGVTTTRAETFSYDDEIRLRSASESLNGGALQTESFTLDALANRTQHSKPGGATTQGTWLYDANNRITRKGEGANATTYDWDANGNLIAKTEAGGKVTRFAYDSQNRLVAMRDGTNNLIARYGYDPFNRRLWKEQYRDMDQQALGQGRRTLFLYADEGLIAEATQGIQLNADLSVTSLGAPEITTQYGPTPGSLFTTDTLFVKTRNQGNTDVFAYLQQDHLGTAMQAVDRSGAVVWAARYDAFGGASVVTPSSVSAIEFRLRLPGQYLDDETGLHYNWNRYYDHSIGRYVQADPLRFDGGINYYLYAVASPTRSSDPSGLEATTAPTPPRPAPIRIPAPAPVPWWVWPLLVLSGDSAKHEPCTCTNGEMVYRGDKRQPHVVFPTGFTPWGTNMNLLEHARGDSMPPYNNRPLSGYVSTSRSMEEAKKMAAFGGYVYKICLLGGRGVDLNQTLGANSPHPSEQEVAVPGAISRGEIMSSRWVGTNWNLGPEIVNDNCSCK